MKKMLFSSISFLSLFLLASCGNPSHEVTEQEFIDALNLKDVKFMQRIQHIKSDTHVSTLTWYFAPNICREVEERLAIKEGEQDSYIERYIIPKSETTDTWVIKKRTNKTESSYETEETTNPTWFKTLESDDVMPMKILKTYGEGILDTYNKYTFEIPIDTYYISTKTGPDNTCQAMLQFTNKKCTYCKVLSIYHGGSFGQTFEFKYNNIDLVFPN